MKNKSILFVISAIIILVMILLSFIFFQKPIKNKKEIGKLSVITTLYPLYDFAKVIGGDKVNVTLVLPPGVEPHAFEPKPNDVMAINQADVFIYTGEFMEVWADDILQGLSNNDLKIVDTSENVPVMKREEKHEHDENEMNHQEHSHKDDGVDPHIWLDFDNVKIMIENIAKGLIEKDPSNKDYYIAHLEEYKKIIDQIDKNYRSTLETCKTKQVVYGGHYAFGYMTKKYGLQYLPAIKGFEPNTEPTANDLVLLVSQVRENNIKYIFYEELASSKVAETIGEETGAKLLLLNAAHNVSKNDLSRGVSFLSIMEENLANLKIGLECQ